RNGLIRATIPLVIMTGIALSLRRTESDQDQARSTFIVGIIIASVAGLSVIYEVERWSLFRQSALHFLCMAVTVFPCLLISGWFDTGSFGDVSRLLLIFLLCGLALWGVAYVVVDRIFNRG